MAGFISLLHPPRPITPRKSESRDQGEGDAMRQHGANWPAENARWIDSIARSNHIIHHLHYYGKWRREMKKWSNGGDLRMNLPAENARWIGNIARSNHIIHHLHCNGKMNCGKRRRETKKPGPNAMIFQSHETTEAMCGKCGPAPSACHSGGRMTSRDICSRTFDRHRGGWSYFPHGLTPSCHTRPRSSPF